MAEINVSSYGAKISITNTSTAKVFTVNNEGFVVTTTVSDNGGFISPAYTSVAFVNTVVPQTVIKVPSFVTYKVNTINPGDTVTFVVTMPDEILYYQGFVANAVEGISITVEELEEPTVNLQDVTVTPSTEEQTITAEEGYDGIGIVTVNAVTASIDENIVAENIKKDVEILGVTGSYEGSGGAAYSSGIVNFSNARGQIVYSYTADEFLQLTTMPANPVQNGLVCQGWNWSLADAQSYVSQYGYLNIGQMYVSENENVTKLYVNITNSILSPTLALCPNGDLTIDWGDNTATDTMTGEDDTTLVYLNHTYSAPGSYVISVTPTQGSTFGFGSNNSETTILCKNDSSTTDENQPYLTALTDIYIGNSVTTIDGYTFYNYYSNLTIVLLLTIDVKYLEFSSYDSNNKPYVAGVVPASVTIIEDPAYEGYTALSSAVIPNSVTNISGHGFSYISGLNAVTIPNSVTGIGEYAFSECGLAFLSISNSVTNIEDSAFYNSGASLITLPSSVVNIGNNTFSDNYAIERFIIPNGVVNIGDGAFYNIMSLGAVIIPNSVVNIGISAFESSRFTSITMTDSVMRIGRYAFSGATYLTSAVLSNSINRLNDGLFNDCSSLTLLTIPENATTIGNNACFNCCSLSSITIPNKVTTIYDSAFSSCFGLTNIEFLPTTPPNLGNNVFDNVPTSCIFYIPNGTYSAYTTANNYPDPNDYLYIERPAT